jgi:AcrR family transcriptional regulator
LEKERKIQIIKAAVKRFGKHGLNKTTLDEIARDLRIGKATIYHYFDSKESLYFETVKWEAFQFIEEIKSIFNNEDLDMKDRFFEYFRCKEETDQKYKLLFELLIIIIKDSGMEKELKILQDFLKEEEQVLMLVLSSVYSSKLETMNPGLPAFLVMQSWGFFFGSKLNTTAQLEKLTTLKDLFYKTIEKIL